MEKKKKVLIVGGGAAGLIAAVRLSAATEGVMVAERGARCGRKLAATGNGQGNVTNSFISPEHYRCGEADFPSHALSRYDYAEAEAFYRGIGIYLTKEEGKKYPLSLQASAVSDALRLKVEFSGAELVTDCNIVRAEKSAGVFSVYAADGRAFHAEKLLFAFGGKAGAQFGTDGTAYALAKGFSHTVTPLYPSLVQLKTETERIRGLKGIRMSARVKARGRYDAESEGDVIFTDYGVSGSAVFAVSGAVAAGGELEIEFLPEIKKEELYAILREKSDLPYGGILDGIVHKQLGRMLEKNVKGDLRALVSALKSFRLKVVGAIGFDTAQVTAGGVCTAEVDARTMESKLIKGLYFAGEALDVDGDCGGYNLHWAFASASIAADSILKELFK